MTWLVIGVVWALLAGLAWAFFAGASIARNNRAAKDGEDYAETRRRMDAVDAGDDGFVPAELRDWLRKRGERGRNL